MMMPLTIAVFTHFIGRRLPEHRYSLEGGTDADAALVDRLLASEDSAAFIRAYPSDPESALRLGDLEAVVEIAGSLAMPSEQGVKVIVRYSSAQESQQAAGLIASRLASYGQQVASQRMAELGLASAIIQPVHVVLENATPDHNPSLASVFFPLIVLMWITVGAMYPAADVTAGEKDRRTIGDILVTPATRLEITMGKFMAVFMMSLVTLVIATASTLLGIEIGDIAALRISAGQTNLPALIWIVPTALLTTAIVTALEMIASVFAKSFREAQTYLTPIFMAILIPGGLLAIAPDLAHEEWLYLIPFMNNTMLLRELLLGVVSTEHVVSTLLSSLMGTLGLLALIVVLFEREDVLFRV